MCHDWYWGHFYEEREADRELWDEFERTRPLSDTEPADEEAEITLQPAEADPVAAEH